MCALHGGAQQQCSPWLPKLCSSARRVVPLKLQLDRVMIQQSLTAGAGANTKKTQFLHIGFLDERSLCESETSKFVGSRLVLHHPALGWLLQTINTSVKPIVRRVLPHMLCIRLQCWNIALCHLAVRHYTLFQQKVLYSLFLSVCVLDGHDLGTLSLFTLRFLLRKKKLNQPELAVMFFMFTGQIFSNVAQDRHEGRCGGPMCTAQRLLHFFFF